MPGLGQAFGIVAGFSGSGPEGSYLNADHHAAQLNGNPLDAICRASEAVVVFVRRREFPE
jgi:hypothetical protein